MRPESRNGLLLLMPINDRSLPQAMGLMFLAGSLENTLKYALKLSASELSNAGWA